MVCIGGPHGLWPDFFLSCCPLRRLSGSFPLIPFVLSVCQLKQTAMKENWADARAEPCASAAAQASRIPAHAAGFSPYRILEILLMYINVISM
jgi:hypothetical protein